MGFDQYSDPEQVLAWAAISSATLLLFSPKALGFLFARVGWPDQDASRLTVPGRLEKPFFSAVGILLLATVVWALTPSTAATVPLAWSAVALTAAAACGGVFMLLALMQYALTRWLGNGRNAILVGTAAYSLSATLAQVGSIRMALLVVNAVVGALLLVSIRIFPRLAFFVMVGTLVFALVAGAIFLTVGIPPGS